MEQANGGGEVIFHRFFETSLAQASFLIGCEETRQAIVVDPNRDIQQYINFSEENRLHVVAVTETHIHADYASGSRELAHRLHVPLYLSDEGPAEWKYAIRGEFETRMLHDEDRISVGNITLEAIATPGHTPEHLCFLVSDRNESFILTGDFIFVGDVGRPDLLERAAGFEGTMEASARVLFQSLQKFKSRFTNEIALWPGHGAGSSCGKSLGSDPCTTLGNEKATNWALRADSESEFVAEVLVGQPDPPKYFAEMKRLNKIGAFLPSGIPQPAQVESLPEDMLVVDVRPSEIAAAGHYKNAHTMEVGNSLPNWAGWLLPYDKPFYLIAQNQQEANRAARLLLLVGLDQISGWIDSSMIPLEATVTTKEIRARDLHLCCDARILDVRSHAEYADGHIPGATHIPLSQLEQKIGDLDPTRSFVVHCGGGSRSAIAAGVLQRHGFRNVIDMVDGYRGYVDLEPAIRG